MAVIGSVWAAPSWANDGWEDDSWAAAAVAEEPGRVGRYAAEHAGALADVAAAHGFAAEHAGARSDLAAAGIG